MLDLKTTGPKFEHLLPSYNLSAFWNAVARHSLGYVQERLLCPTALTIHLLFVGPARVKVRVCSIRIPTAWADRIQSGIKQPQSVSHFGMLRGIGALDLVPSQR